MAPRQTSLRHSDDSSSGPPNLSGPPSIEEHFYSSARCYLKCAHAAECIFKLCRNKSVLRTHGSSLVFSIFRDTELGSFFCGFHKILEKVIKFKIREDLAINSSLRYKTVEKSKKKRLSKKFHRLFI